MTVHGVRIRFLQAGHGRPVLLLHGEGGVAENWCDVMAGLAHRYRALAVDLPGNGNSDPIAASTPAAQAAFLWRFLRTIGVSGTALVGHSLGGAVAVHMALRRPAHVSRLVLIGSTGMGRAMHPGLVLRAASPLGELSLLVPGIPLGPELLVTWLSLIGAARPGRLPPTWWHSQVRAASSPEALATALRAQRSITGPFGQRRLLLDHLRNLTMPTLVLWGVQDRVLPYRQALRAVQRLPDARLVLIPHSGHLLPVEAPGGVLDAVIPFLHAG
ncbi:alpha/beta fold hydrolase [Streptomyces sp. WELS2]|uniref:alpha/beta fold hydrolase n=1 Tax=Streptomyces sp. WELS2 TaxID=2749435 RepID=UPI0015F0BE9D|nr:alpha/beta fold hydrolase [Streptomyces sp. WELS2]